MLMHEALEVWFRCHHRSSAHHVSGWGSPTWAIIAASLLLASGLAPGG